MASIFSKIIAGEIPCYKIAEDDKHFAFLDAFPVVKGHTLVVPKKEMDKLFDMPLDEYTELMTFSYKISQAIEKAVPCLRVGLAVQGLEVPHAHIHLMPLNSPKDMQFFDKIELSPDEFSDIADKIKSYL
ncbi:HIT family protein [Apibacter raozihei]|uniref:HIT family protein n=1 Tax=Apibacter raozihei TaxID=2500547 RepID=UPI000FE35ADF|nr:HIT family protein [Apibacter raozihei]